MEGSQEAYRSEWVDDYRQARRWLDSRTVLARLDGNESLGKTLDVSTGGMQVAFEDLAPLTGRRLEMAVVFGDRIVDLGGTVLHRTRSGDGCAVGLEFDQPLDGATAAFLADRYPAAMADAVPGVSGTA